jgi:rhodanese-related sulfurtransferase
MRIKLTKGKVMHNFQKYIFSILFLISFSFTACAQESREHEMSVSQLKSAMKSDSSLVILDVRTPEELSGPLGHIDGVINIPVQVLADSLSQLDQFKDNTIAVICRTGRRSGIATKILREKGFNAANVAGGMTAYRQEEENYNK